MVSVYLKNNNRHLLSTLLVVTILRSILPSHSLRQVQTV